MYSSPALKNYFFVILGLLAIYLSLFFYLHSKDNQLFWTTLGISLASFFINVIIIINLKVSRKLTILLIYGLLFTSCTQIFFNLYIGIAYLILSIVLLLLLDITPISSSFKYFNVGMLTTIASFLYFPIGINVILFFIVTILFYDNRINISQYLAGVLTTILLMLEVLFLADNFSYVTEWMHGIMIPQFHYEYQIPIIILLFFTMIYGLINQYKDKNISDDADISKKYSLSILYLVSWIIIYTFFMGDNYSLLIFVCLPISIISSKGIQQQ